MRSAAEMRGVLKEGLESLAWSRGVMDKAIDATPAEHRFTRPWPNGNHLLFHIAHLAWSEEVVVTGAGGAPFLPEGWADRFGWDPVVPEREEDCPSFEEARRWFDESRRRVVETYSALPPEKLAAATPEEMHPFATTVGRLLHSQAMHETMHAGQVMALRRAVGLPRMLP